MNAQERGSSKAKLWLWWLLVCCACNGVGRGLVNQETPSTGEDTGCETMPCEGVLPEMIVPETPFEYGNLSNCAEASTTKTSSLPIQSCDCQNYELSGLDTNAVPIQLTGATKLSHCRLSISSDRPIELQLVKTALEDVHIVLSGPVALRMSQAQLARVSIDASGNAGGEPTLTLEQQSNVSEFTLHTAGSRRISALRMSLTTLDRALLEAESMQLISVSITRSSLSAQDVDASDAHLSEGVLELDRGLLSPVFFRNMSLPRCRNVTFVASELSNTEVSCSELMQLYSCHNVQNCALDGPLEFDDVDLSNTIFGLRRSTTILSYLSRFNTTTFCDGVREARLSGGGATCGACEGPLLTGEGELCSDGTFSADATENACSSFVGGLRRCTDFPPRPRPN